MPFFTTLKAGKNFIWKEECDQAFKVLKDYLKSPLCPINVVGCMCHSGKLCADLFTMLVKSCCQLTTLPPYGKVRLGLSCGASQIVSLLPSAPDTSPNRTTVEVGNVESRSIRMGGSLCN